MCSRKSEAASRDVPCREASRPVRRRPDRSYIQKGGTRVRPPVWLICYKSRHLGTTKKLFCRVWFF